ncbi:hypothetical protein GCM10010497_16400 [Streptomyces cinereoruber]|uniref:DUF488 family protein n=1 Tax=Streptomyces cinereoruber TaxID=67260 RepID=A0AAV4KD34_9ACTN|nr:DUF488 family protein [Streptomyces cinereoruber]MBB4157904.1 uncharacterized protein YeaO (DUF488 family) [Streptomyces cinereoruber]MBY8816184.1 DUF488 family protein [Streptomyces cinereoruber]NIH61943.1 uncharacterized protein YeaO (DUF488 family) [Streptomyces cinereoruber]QEV35755.1 DUF488 family protein [Streptomyces cinereoruber]GGR14854.1 hypothetical protein GCM10010497_16400 [Streptomyces cinereoruber]
MAAHTPAVRVRRVYGTPSPDDGVRVLVDRLRPRGLAKADAHVDEWPKALTPSTELRHWYHGPEGAYEEFRRRYGAELAAPAAAEALASLKDLATRQTVTLLTATKDPSTSHAAVLREEIEGAEE